MKLALAALVSSYLVSACGGDDASSGGPVETFSAEPTVGVPVIAGRAIDATPEAGAIGPSRLAAARPEPDESFAVTMSAIVLPASAVASAYVGCAAPGMATHELPRASQRSHWYE